MKRDIDWIDNQVIYQIMVDRFNGKWRYAENGNHFMGGTLEGINRKLEYIRDMGFTAIWLSPVNCTLNYHGYHVTDFMNIDSHFGSMDDFKRLIDRIHELEMKVIVDFVPNHCSVEHPYFKQARDNVNSKYRDWFYFDDSKIGYKCFLQYEELAKINLDNPETADYMIDVARFYCRCGVDGLRIDHAVGPSFGFWKKAMGQLKIEFSDRIFFGEIWAYGIRKKYFNTLHFKSLWRKIRYYLFSINQECWQRDYVGTLDGVLDFEYRSLLLKEIEKGRRIMNNKELECKVEQHFKRYPENYKLLLFLDNHDTDRFLFNCKGDVSLLEEAVKFSLKWNRPFIVYYGTEQGMKNNETIFSGKPYADLSVRECMDWNKDINETLYADMKEWLKRK